MGQEPCAGEGFSQLKAKNYKPSIAGERKDKSNTLSGSSCYAILVTAKRNAGNYTFGVTCAPVWGASGA